MAAIYLELLRRIESSGFQVFGGKIRVPRWRQAAVAAGAWVSSMVRR
jgi:hypothetical protein